MTRFFNDSVRMMVVLSAALLICGTACDDKVKSESSVNHSARTDTAPRGQPMKAPDKMGDASPSNRAKSETKPGVKPEAKLEITRTQQTAVAEPAPVVKPAPIAKPVPTAQPTPVAEPAPTVAKDDLETKRSQAEDMIYATIRIKMEDAIVERAKLLKEGHDPSDERVRQLEGTIMRARELLTENGEMVGEVDPPIVQSQPKR